jgi:thiol-disulfide isomerase/thioredoxin
MFSLKNLILTYFVFHFSIFSSLGMQDTVYKADLELSAELSLRIDSCRKATLDRLKMLPIYKTTAVHETSNINKVFKLQDTVLVEVLSLIDSYTGNIHDNILQLQQANAIGRSQANKLRYLMAYFAKSEQGDVNLIIKDILPLVEMDVAVEPSILIQSEAFLDYQIDKARFSSLVKRGKGVEMIDSFSEIENNYKGLLREALMTRLLIKCYSRTSLEKWTSIAKEVVEKISDQEHKVRLEQKLERNGMGAKVFDFALPDTSENIIRLNDFRGKVVIIDFWFTGCGACKKLAKDLKEIADLYHGNDSVVFIGISVDKNRQRWINSVKSGDYADKETINLYTDGMGENHPMIKYYGFTGYPNLMIIDVNGNLAAIPPRPQSEEEISVFLDVIDGLI